MKVLLKTLMALSLMTFMGASPEKGGTIAKGRVEIDDKLLPKTKGVKTLFITIFDASSPGPMPWGATKIELKGDAKKVITEFDLNPSNFQVMRPSAPPKKINVKARLDADGSAGSDQKGDFIGFAKDVPYGATDVVVKIDQGL